MKFHRSQSKQVFVCFGLSLALGGCAGIFPPTENREWLDGHAYMVGAKPLDSFDAYKQPANTTGAKDLLGTIVADSQAKCGNFLSELALSQTSENLGLDVATTVFSALGTAFTPVATIHALTAAGSITGGWKTALDSDLYAKATIANYAQAIQASYYKDMKTYTDALTAMDANKVIASIEYTKIQSTHAECSLASAQATISATLQSGTSAAQSTLQTKTFTVDASIPANEILELSGSSSSFKTPTILAKFPSPPGGSPILRNDAAKGLAAAVNGDPNFQSNQISATNPNAPSNVVVLSWPAAVAISWDPPKTVQPPTPGMMGSARPPTIIGSFVQTSGGGASQTTSGGVPGHSLQ